MLGVGRECRFRELGGRGLWCWCGVWCGGCLRFRCGVRSRRRGRDRFPVLRGEGLDWWVSWGWGWAPGEVRGREGRERGMYIFYIRFGDETFVCDV